MHCAGLGVTTKSVLRSMGRWLHILVNVLQATAVRSLGELCGLSLELHTFLPTAHHRKLQVPASVLLGNHPLVSPSPYAHTGHPFSGYLLVP